MSLFSFYLEYYNVLYFFYDDFSNWWNTFKLGPTLILSFSHSSFVFSEFSNNFSSLYLLDISYSLPVIVSSSFFGRCSTGHLLIAVLRRLQHTGSKNIFDVSGCAGPVLYPFSRPSVPFLWHMIRRANWTFIMQIRARPRSSSARIAGKKTGKDVPWNEFVLEFVVRESNWLVRRSFDRVPEVLGKFITYPTRVESIRALAL